MNHPCPSAATASPGREAAVGFRPVADSDREFLFKLYASTRAEELAMVPWNDTERATFLRSQFAAQDRFYREHYPGAEWQIVLVEDRPAGRRYLHRREEEIRIMDLALMPAYRGKGVGTALLRQVMSEAVIARKRVTIHVESFNPARRLYERLGFTKTATHGVYYLMEWRPAGVRVGPEQLLGTK